VCFLALTTWFPVEATSVRVDTEDTAAASLSLSETCTSPAASTSRRTTAAIATEKVARRGKRHLIIDSQYGRISGSSIVANVSSRKSADKQRRDVYGRWGI
jgi:hypothetical protein